MLSSLENLEEKIKLDIMQAEDDKELKAIRIKYLGKKGKITNILRSLNELPPEKRPQAGKIANELKKFAEQLLHDKEKKFSDKKQQMLLAQEAIDVTLPGSPVSLGHKHPLTIILEEIEDIFTSLGFSVVEGPEVETDYYNFEALNLPKDHPARDMQDSFYITNDILLRTQTSPVQVHTMEQFAPKIPVRIISPGKVYRRDDDATHSPMFHQVEGLAIDKDISFADLKGVLLHFARQMFGEERDIRLRPSFFPFTEPSAEVDISCVNCGGSGCRVCSYTGWLEILGSGMVHPNVLSMSGYNPREVTGFAFGMGVERIAMLKYGFDDLRAFFTNDLRMLQQF